MVSSEAGTARGRIIKSGQFSLLQRGQHPRDFQLKGKEGRKREENKEHHAWRFVPVMPTVVRLGRRSTADLRSA